MKRSKMLFYVRDIFIFCKFMLSAVKTAAQKKSDFFQNVLRLAESLYRGSLHSRSCLYSGSSLLRLCSVKCQLQIDYKRNSSKAILVSGIRPAKAPMKI